MNKMMIMLLVLVGLTFLGGVKGQECSSLPSCGECLSGDTCFWCPSHNKCLLKDENGQTLCPLGITDREKCESVSLCGTQPCPEGEICNFFSTNPTCVCADCMMRDAKGACTVPRCSDLEVCSENKCKCAEGLTLILEGDKRKCANLTCGGFEGGCGPNTECLDGECVCLEGFVPSSSSFGDLVGPGCVKGDPVCADFCTFDHAICVGDLCTCEAGYERDLSSGGCVLVEDYNPDANCSSYADSCEKCARDSSCVFCVGAAGEGKCISSSSNDLTTCSQLASTGSQCSCLSGCKENEICALTGCVCKPGFEYLDGKCVDTSNPCASFECRLSEEVCQTKTSSTGDVIPFCVCKPGYLRTSDGYCKEAPTTCSDSTLCNCVYLESIQSTFCCVPPKVVDKDEMRCRFKCPDGIFEDDPLDCDCPEGKIRDLVTLRCTDPCKDGSAPREGRCGITCPEGMSPNPKYDPTNNGTSTQPPCVYICPDGTMVSDKEECLAGCETDPSLICPCEEGQVRDLKTFVCTEPCPETGAIPADGKCPQENFCLEGFPFTFPDGTVACVKKCEDGTLVKVGEDCPERQCPEGQVEDRYTGQCASPCSDGNPPFNGNCPIVCTDSTECCNAALEGTEKCPPPACPDGTKRNSLGECVTVCPDGSLPLERTGNCSVGCPLPGSFQNDDGVCVFECPDGKVVKELKECCPHDLLFSVSLRRCLCLDGSFPVEGKCSAIPPPPCDSTSTCVCSFPLVKGDNGKCECPDPVAYPDPFDGRRCGINPCPSGLRAVEGKCVCPLTGRLPERDDKNVTYCPCDPSKYEHCPLTPRNCKDSSFPPCFCLLHPEDVNCTTSSPLPPRDACEANPTRRDCFCRIHPEAEECRNPPLCLLNPQDPSCAQGTECNMKAVIEGRCTREEFCKAHPEVDECVCFKSGSCSREGVPVADGVSFLDLKRAQCSEEDSRNKTNLPCYCKANFDLRLCFCFLHPSDEKCKNPDGSSQVPKPEVVVDKGCKVLTKILDLEGSSCERKATTEEGDNEVQITIEEKTSKVRDLVQMAVQKVGEQVGLLELVRSAEKGEDAPSDAVVDDSNVASTLRFRLHSLFELLDEDQDNTPSDGDSRVSEIIIKDITWTASVSTNDLGMHTVTLSSPDGSLLLSYALSQDDTSAGTAPSTLAARIVKISLFVNYPYQSTSSKLGFDFFLGMDDSTVPTLSGNDVIFGDKGTLSFEGQIEAGGTSIKVTLSSIRPLPQGGFLVSVVAHSFTPAEIVFDPTLSSSSSPPTTENLSETPESAASFLSLSSPLFFFLVFFNLFVFLLF